MDLMNMDFFEMNNAALKRVNFHWGKINVVDLLEAAGFNEEPNGQCWLNWRDRVSAHEDAPEIFDCWMTQNLSETQKFLIEINFGQDEIKYPCPTLFDHEILWRTHDMNLKDLEVAFEAIRQEMRKDRYLYHALLNIGFGRASGGEVCETDPNCRWCGHRDVKMKMQNYYGRLWHRLAGMYGVKDVEGEYLWDEKIYYLMTCKIKPDLVRNAVLYALVGRGEIYFDRNWKIYGIDKVEDMYDELQEKCWNKYVEKSLRPEYIIEALRQYIEEKCVGAKNLKEIERAQQNYVLIPAAAFTLRMFERAAS